MLQNKSTPSSPAAPSRADTKPPGGGAAAQPFSPAQKQHSGATTKLHNFKIPACELQQIVVVCSHVKPDSKPAPARGCKTGGSAQAPAQGSAPADDAKQGGRRLIVPEPETGAQTKSAQTGRGKSPASQEIVFGVVPSGLTNTRKQSLSLLSGAITLEVEHSYGSAKTGDKMTFTCETVSCKQHPLWTIKDGDSQLPNSTTDKLEFAFLPPVSDESLLPSVFHALWLKDVAPRVYQVSCKTCKGSEKVKPVTVNVYPNKSSSVAMTFGKSEKEDADDNQHPLSGLFHHFWKVLKFLNEEFGIVPEDHVQTPRGSVTIANSWTEDEDSHYAYWGGSVEIGLDPVVGVKCKVPLAPALALGKFVPKFIKKYASVDVYLEVTSGIKMSGEGEWTLKSDKVHLSGSLPKALGGEMKLNITSELHVGTDRHKVLAADVHGDTGIDLTGGLKFTDEGEIEMKIESSWDGLSLTGEVAVWDGFFHAEVTHKVVEGGKLFSPSFVLWKKEDAAGGGA